MLARQGSAGREGKNPEQGACLPTPGPSIGSTEDPREAVAMLESADAVLVHEDGKPVGVLTRQDLLAFLAGIRE